MILLDSDDEHSNPSFPSLERVDIRAAEAAANRMGWQPTDVSADDLGSDGVETTVRRTPAGHVCCRVRRPG